MYTHIVKFYIDKPKLNSSGIRASPVYPIEMWNCYQCVLDGDEIKKILYFIYF